MEIRGGVAPELMRTVRLETAGAVIGGWEGPVVVFSSSCSGDWMIEDEAPEKKSSNGEGDLSDDLLGGRSTSVVTSDGEYRFAFFNLTPKT